MNKSPESVLKKFWGFSTFREPQKKIIESIVRGNDVLAVLPTGFGKSLTYQVAGLLLEKPVLIISPLIALMNDQVNSLLKKGLKATALSGKLSRSQLINQLDNIRLGQYQFVFLSPERLQNVLVREHLNEIDWGFITIDEAHCVSEWGHDFRPDYLKIRDLRNDFPEIPLLALTATAKPETRQDIIRQLELKNPEIYIRSFYRKNIRYSVYGTEDKFRFVKNLFKDKKSGIVYVNTRRQSVRIAEYLNQLNVSAAAFHGGLKSDEKKDILRKWIDNKIQIIVGTSAFGMGIDKPDVKRVIHMEIPWSLEQYVQEAGRAGRNGEPAQAFMVLSQEDKEIFLQLLDAQIPDFSFIKEIANRVYVSHFIAEGEGEGVQKDFDPVKWSKKYGYHTYKTVSALKILENQGLWILENADSYQSKIQIISNPEQVREYIEYFKDTHKTAQILELLVRSFPDIFAYPVRIQIQDLEKKWSVSQNEIKKYLKILHNQHWILWEESRSQMQIFFLRNRQDSYLNMLRKPIENYLKIRRDKALEMLRYTENRSQCRVEFIKQYFDEEKSFACGQCDVCINANQTSKKIPDETEILEYIKINQPIDFHSLVNHFGQKEILETIVRNLLENDSIEFDKARNLIIKN